MPTAIGVSQLIYSITLFTYSKNLLEPRIHYGRCKVQGKTGYCLNPQNCWEKSVNINRTLCPDHLQNDLVCCRKAPMEQVIAPSNLIVPQPGVCGTDTNAISDRVIAGTESGIMEYPWMALLRYTKDGKFSLQSCIITYTYFILHLCNSVLYHILYFYYFSKY